MLTLTRTESDNPDFIELVRLLNADLAERNGEDNVFYGQFNTITKIKYVVVGYEEGVPVGCGAMKEFAPTTLEIKRIYTLPESRGMGVATRILAELEQWATAFRYKTCVLETGKRQPEAIALYEKNGYNRIPNYGQYAGVDNSICFEKVLHP